MGPVGTAITGFFKSLPEVLALVKRLWDAFDGLAQLAKDKRMNDYLDDLRDTTKKLGEATSLRERVDAAKRLDELTRRM